MLYYLCGTLTLWYSERTFTIDLVEELIGEDVDEYPNTLSTKDSHKPTHNVNAMFNNQFRAKLRQKLRSNG